MGPQVAVAEAGWEKPEDYKSGHECHDPGIAETQSGGALLTLQHGAVKRLEGAMADRAVVARCLDVEETPVGGEADLPERREVEEPSADAEVLGVVDRGLGAKSATLLVILLDRAAFVLDAE
jgi:hypothetical protein